VHDVNAMRDVEKSRPLEPGARLGRYELLAQVASGGMGAVWAARTHEDELVALKTILPTDAEKVALRTMFLDEARVAMLLADPNICRVIDLGNDGGTLYMVLEWIEGDSLRTALHEGMPAPSIDVALPICRALCDALEAAHQLRSEDGEPLALVHRDVSPHNVLLGFDGSVKLIDFGIAKTRQRLSETTNSGVLRGKLRYMAPEQVEGSRAVDRRADLWSLGAVLYALVTGVELFGDASEADILRILVMREGLPELPPTVPSAVAAIVQRALAFAPDARFQTARDMRAAIDAVLPPAPDRDRTAIAAFARARLEEPVRARRALIADARRRVASRDALVTSRRRRGQLALAGAFGTVFAVTIAAFAFARSSGTVAATATNAVVVAPEEGAAAKGAGSDPRVSPPPRIPAGAPVTSAAATNAPVASVAPANAASGTRSHAVMKKGAPKKPARTGGLGAEFDTHD